MYLDGDSYWSWPGSGWTVAAPVAVRLSPEGMQFCSQDSLAGI
jgi:hypothetical protein